jgi:hypothetical protein
MRLSFGVQWLNSSLGFLWAGLVIFDLWQMAFLAWSDPVVSGLHSKLFSNDVLGFTADCLFLE